MVHEPIKTDLYEFIKHETGTSKTLSSETSLFHDLGVDGDDANEFFESYFEKFSVLPGDIDLNDYFSSEGFNLIGIIIDIFFRKTPPLKPMTISMLAKAIELGEWNTKQIERAQ